MHLISTYYARLVLRELNLQDAGIKAILVDTGLQPDDIFHLDTISYPSFDRLLCNALAHSSDPALGLKFGRHVSPFASIEVGQASMSAPNLLEALRALASFSQLQAGLIKVRLVYRPGVLVVEQVPIGIIGESARTQHEVYLLTIRNIVESITGTPFTEGRYLLAFPMPDYADQYQGCFKSPLQFSSETTSVEIPEHLLQSKSPFFNQSHWEKGKLLCQSLLSERASSHDKLFSNHVQNLLKSFPLPLPGQGGMARQLFISERTLSRRLNAEGSSYRALHQSELHQRACFYLRNSNLKIEAIATELGYADPANFQRAFKKWQHVSPARYRNC